MLGSDIPLTRVYCDLCVAMNVLSIAGRLFDNLFYGLHEWV